MDKRDGPFLASCDSAERRAAAAKVLDLLRPVSRKDTERFVEADDDSDKSSDIPDPFSDDECNQTDFAQRRKRMSKNDADILLMNSFSEEHKRVERLVRQQTGILDTDDMCRENLREVSPTSVEYVESPEFVAECNALVARTGLDVYLKKKEQEELERLAKSKSKKQPMRPPPAARRAPAADPLDDESMSGVWRMLEAPSPERGFTITQPGYNVLDDERLDWLQREDMTWQQRDEVKHKCEKWIKKCNI